MPKRQKLLPPSKERKCLRQIVMSHPAAVKNSADAVAALGDIDILVNNAGHNITEPFEDISETSFERMLNVHVKGIFMTQSVYAT